MRKRIVSTSLSLSVALFVGCAAENDRHAGASALFGGDPMASGNPDAPVSSDQRHHPPAAPDAPTAECPVLNSSGWTATVLGLPPSSPDRLRVVGSVTMPASGYRLSLEAGPVLEIHPPIQRIELRIAEPDTSSAPAPETRHVQGEFPALAEYGEIQIRCGRRLLATIRDIAWTQ